MEAVTETSRPGVAMNRPSSSQAAADAIPLLVDDTYHLFHLTTPHNTGHREGIAVAAVTMSDGLEERGEAGGASVLKDLFSGAVGGVAQVLIGT